jgi:hypothetical protein
MEDDPAVQAHVANGHPRTGVIGILPTLKASRRYTSMNSESAPHPSSTIDIRPFKERLRKKLSPDSLVLLDLLSEPDFMSVNRAEILVPHYLQRLERELNKHEPRRTQLIMRSS